MSDAVLREIRDLIQADVNHRGLATDPAGNLINACPDDFAAACRSIAETPNAALCVVTGFWYIAYMRPALQVKPMGRWEASCSWRRSLLTPLGIRVALKQPISFCQTALQAGVEFGRGLDERSVKVPWP